MDMKSLPDSYILPISSVDSGFNRIVLHFLSDYVGPLNVNGPVLSISGFLVLAWTFVRSVRRLLLTVAICRGHSPALSLLFHWSLLQGVRLTSLRLGSRLSVIFSAMEIGSVMAPQLLELS
jgi:hypothetical protein